MSLFQGWGPGICNSFQMTKKVVIFPVAITGESEQPVITFYQIIAYLETDKSLLITRDKCRLVQMFLLEIIALRVMLEK